MKSTDGRSMNVPLSGFVALSVMPGSEYRDDQLFLSTPTENRTTSAMGQSLSQANGQKHRSHDQVLSQRRDRKSRVAALWA